MKWGYQVHSRPPQEEHPMERLLELLGTTRPMLTPAEAFCRVGTVCPGRQLLHWYEAAGVRRRSRRRLAVSICELLSQQESCQTEGRARAYRHAAGFLRWKSVQRCCGRSTG